MWVVVVIHILDEGLHMWVSLYVVSISGGVAWFKYTISRRGCTFRHILLFWMRRYVARRVGSEGMSIGWSM